MIIGEAVKARILELCRERELSINRLCIIHSEQYYQRTQQQRHHFYHKKAL